MLTKPFKLLFLIIKFLFLFNISCSTKESKIEIRGNIPNLPNGKIYLCQESLLEILDSVTSENGKFNFNLKNVNEPVYLLLKHIDKKGVLRVIGFKTNGKYKNAGYEASSFLSDSVVTIDGNLKDNTPIGFSSNNKTKLVTAFNIHAGYQTTAMFNTDGDLFVYINKQTYKKVLNKIKEYSNSFHLLYQINNNRNSFTAIQVEHFLSLFKGEITESKTYGNLKKYNDKRQTKNTILPLLNNKGVKTEVLNTNFKKHLVVFWASWCGPCRQEIPALKIMYEKYKDKIEFVSISTDAKNELWQKALEKEKMPWKQLVVTEGSKEYESVEIFFQLSTSIPFTALVDENMKVLKSSVGMMTKDELEKFITK